jgi:putative acetyltransferase
MPDARLPDLHVDIRVDDLRGAAIIALLHEHLAAMRRVSPPESVHALDVTQLRQPNVTFWTAWDGETLAGCAALKELDLAHGEIKSMRTASSYVRRGVASSLLGHLIAEARRRRYRRLSLETGAMDYFAPARRLYGTFGFVPCPPFAAYCEDPNSVFMTRELA